MKPNAFLCGQRGFTLVELMITVTVLTILMLAAAPSMQLWIFNTRIRTAAESLQNGLRLAQSEAVSQNRQVLFALTAVTPGVNVVTVADGRNWVAQTVRNAVEGAGTERFIRGGPLADVTGGVLIEGPTYTDGIARSAICFSGLGNLVANANPAPGPPTTGAACGASAVAYAISHPSGDRPLRVQVSLGGRVRMCDPSRPAGEPDAC